MALFNFGGLKMIRQTGKLNAPPIILHIYTVYDQVRRSEFKFSIELPSIIYKFWLHIKSLYLNHTPSVIDIVSK